MIYRIQPSSQLNSHCIAGNPVDSWKSRSAVQGSKRADFNFQLTAGLPATFVKQCAHCTTDNTDVSWKNEGSCMTADFGFRLISVLPVIRCESTNFIVKLHPSFTEILCQVYWHHDCIIHAGKLNILLLEQSHDVDCLRKHEFNLQVSCWISSSNSIDSRFHVVDISGKQSANLMSKHCRISN